MTCPGAIGWHPYAIWVCGRAHGVTLYRIRASGRARPQWPGAFPFYHSRGGRVAMSPGRAAAWPVLIPGRSRARGQCGYIHPGRGLQLWAMWTRGFKVVHNIHNYFDLRGGGRENCGSYGQCGHTLLSCWLVTLRPGTYTNM